jgi:hypothetical protein
VCDAVEPHQRFATLWDVMASTPCHGEHVFGEVLDIIRVDASEEVCSQLRSECPVDAVKSRFVRGSHGSSRQVPFIFSLPTCPDHGKRSHFASCHISAGPGMDEVDRAGDLRRRRRGHISAPSSGNQTMVRSSWLLVKRVNWLGFPMSRTELEVMEPHRPGWLPSGIEGRLQAATLPHL